MPPFSSVKQSNNTSGPEERSDFQIKATLMVKVKVTTEEATKA
jgi:hypothetical protein